MGSEEPLDFRDRYQWRKWLWEHHDSTKEAWLVFFKKKTGKASIKYEEAVEEAICFGWIDGKVKRMDEERFMQRYTPRSPGSSWSKLNKARAEKMIREGKMDKWGWNKINAAKRSGKWDLAYTLRENLPLPDDLKAALMLNQQAWDNFSRFPDGGRNMYISWINDAKRNETRQRRIRRVVARSANNIKPGMI